MGSAKENQHKPRIAQKTTFPEPDFEKKYHHYFFEKSISILRITLGLAIILFALFATIDIINFKEQRAIFLFVRFVIIIPYLIFVLIATYFRFFEKIWQELLFIAFVVAGSGVIAILIHRPDAKLHYAGLYLVLFAGYFLVRLRFLPAFVASLFLFFILNGSLLLFADLTGIKLLFINLVAVSAIICCMRWRHI
jgi:hypothetical protein